MESNSGLQWEGKVSTRLTKASADQIWPLFQDFFNLHKWFPGLTTCYGIHGTNGEPGCIRYCSGFSVSSNKQTQIINWSKERLTSINPRDKCLCYEIVETNIGFESYTSKIKVIPNGGMMNGCLIEWSFVVDPVEGWILDNLVKKYETGLKLMANKMEDSVTKIVN